MQNTEEIIVKYAADANLFLLGYTNYTKKNQAPGSLDVFGGDIFFFNIKKKILNFIISKVYFTQNMINFL